MNHAEYYTDDERVYKYLDKQFSMVTLIQDKESGDTNEYKIAIWDSRSEEQIKERADEISEFWNKKA